MKSLNRNQLNILAKELDDTLSSNYIPNIVLISSNDIVFHFSFFREKKLLISLNHSSPFISLIPQEISYSSILNRLCEDLRKYVKDTYIKKISTLNNDRILEINLVKNDDFFVKHDYFLILELIPHHPNLIYLDESRNIIFATHYTDLTSNRLIIKGAKYEAPINNFNKVEDDDLSNFKEEVNEYISNLGSNRLNEKYHELISTIKRKIKVSEKKIDVLNKEMSEAKKALIYQEHGNYILTMQYDKESLENYIKDNNINYDDKLTPSENANLLFKKYKKAKETLRVDELQLIENEEVINKLKLDLDALANNDEALYILLSNIYLNKKLPRQEINKLTPYYITVDGTKIAFGRNASQNDILTFRKAKPDNIFLHLQDYHANHVVILKAHPNDNDILNASMLALALANKEAGTVQYAYRKEIKKGKFPGQVLFNTYSTIKVNEVNNKIKNNLEKAKRLTF